MLIDRSVFVEIDKMSTKYHRLPQNPLSDQEEEDENEEEARDGTRMNFSSPFNYSSIFSYDRSKTFKSPYTYNSVFAKATGDSVHLEKDNKGKLFQLFPNSSLILEIFSFRRSKCGRNRCHRFLLFRSGHGVSIIAVILLEGTLFSFLNISKLEVFSFSVCFSIRTFGRFPFGTITRCERPGRCPDFTMHRFL